ncbi:MAG: metal-dependent hydrolase [Campylobacterota bacterium]|nr:metal-dependent hydrolase [Campylobacterota bacterium]
MTLIKPHYILSPHALIENKAIAFDKKIHSIDDFEALHVRFPEAEIIELEKNSLIMPGLINTHVHLEFSANKTSLEYGSFMPWLHSVIKNRDDLIAECSDVCMQKAIDTMLHSGITSFGAVSSYGLDLATAGNSAQNVVFFNELIGSQAVMADALYSDFLERLNASKTLKREGFYPAIAIHSPYSVHPILIKRALELSKNEKLPLSAHYMESRAEQEWCEHNSGDFAPFFKEFLKQEYAVNSSDEFLSLFEGFPTLMTHVVHANEKQLEKLHLDNHTVIHCPISNRLLGNGAIDLDALDDANIEWLCATDGLSSNYTLNLFEEMKIALFMHHGQDLLPFAHKLLESVTCKAAQALGLNTGAIQEGKNADMLVLNLDETPNEQLALHLILHQYPIQSVYINGTKAL